MPVMRQRFSRRTAKAAARARNYDDLVTHACSPSLAMALGRIVVKNFTIFAPMVIILLVRPQGLLGGR